MPEKKVEWIPGLASGETVEIRFMFAPAGIIPPPVHPAGSKHSILANWTLPNGELFRGFAFTRGMTESELQGIDEFRRRATTQGAAWTSGSIDPRAPGTGLLLYGSQADGTYTIVDTVLPEAGTHAGTA